MVNGHAGTVTQSSQKHEHPRERLLHARGVRLYNTRAYAVPPTVSPSIYGATGKVWIIPRISESATFWTTMKRSIYSALLATRKHGQNRG